MTDPHSELRSALALHQAGRFADAAVIYRRVVKLQPNNAHAIHLLGVVSHQQGNSTEAAALIRRAIAIEPSAASFHNNLGEVLRGQYRLQEAKAAYESALRLKPDYPEALNNLGGVYGQLNDLGKAAQYLRQSIALRPDDPEPHWNLSMALLLGGQWEQGWREFDWRLRRPETLAPAFPKPVWTGEPLANKTLLLWGEQGFGDMIQFFRYVAEIKRNPSRSLRYSDEPDRASKNPVLWSTSETGLGGRCRILLYVHRELASFFASQGIADEVIPADEPAPPFDVHAALMSCPKILGTTVGSVPAAESYLTAPVELVSYWAGKLPQDGTRKVGIAWSGRPTHPNDRRRSIPPELLAPLGKVDNVTFVTVQPRDRSVPTPPGLKMLDVGRELRHFSDTAGLLSQLDLLITVDTSVAHLAAALGKPVWTLLPFAPDWRWLLDRDDTPWYPTMRLFRQRAIGAWDEVIARVCGALQHAGHVTNDEHR